jgi:hypothetical protein
VLYVGSGGSMAVDQQRDVQLRCRDKRTFTLNVIHGRSLPEAGVHHCYSLRSWTSRRSDAFKAYLSGVDPGRFSLPRH